MNIRYLLFLTLAVWCLLPISVMRAEEDPITVGKSEDTRDMGNGYVDNIYVITITSRVDQISINDVKFNRGNCGLSYHNLVSYPTKLAFGQQLRLEPACNVIEAAISTDKGDLIFKWEQ